MPWIISTITKVIFVCVSFDCAHARGDLRAIVCLKSYLVEDLVGDFAMLVIKVTY